MPLRATKESLLSVLDPRRPSPRVAPRDPHAVDVAWALGRVRDWLLGPTPLLTNLTLFVFATLGNVLWQISRHPDHVSLPGWVVIWGTLVAAHVGLVVTYGTLRAWRSPRRRPIYYRAIPAEQRTTARTTQPTLATDQPVMAVPVMTGPVRRQPTLGNHHPVMAPSTPAQPTWSGVLAPVTPFPTLRDAGRSGTELPAAPDHDDVTAVHQAVPGTGQDWPALASPDSALADVRDVLASDQPLWRRWRRRTSTSSGPAELPVDAADSWLSPFPGDPPVTRPDSAARFPGGVQTPTIDPSDAASANHRWPTPQPSSQTSPMPVTQPNDGEQLPSLAAMLRSNNLTTLSDVPITGSRARSGNDASSIPAPEIPTPLSGQSSSRTPRPKTVALFAAFGIDDGNPVAPTASDEAGESRDPADPDRPRPIQDRKPR